MKTIKADMAEAARLATKLGHELRPWKNSPFNKWWWAGCELCGDYVYVQRAKRYRTEDNRRPEQWEIGSGVFSGIGGTAIKERTVRTDLAGGRERVLERCWGLKRRGIERMKATKRRNRLRNLANSLAKSRDATEILNALVNR